MKNYSIKDIAEIGIFTALAIILNLPVFKIKITPDAGSISFVMIPLFIIAIRHSWWKSFIAGGLIFGVIGCLMGGHGFIAYPFDYLIPYGSICLISLLRKLILKENKLSYLYLTISIILVTVIRYFSATFSSMIVYNFQIIPSLIYNAPYVFISGGIGLIAIIFLLKPLKVINKRNTIN